MSYNIDTIHQIAGDGLHIRLKEASSLLVAHERDLPETCFLRTITACGVGKWDVETHIPAELWARGGWHGEGSGSSLPTLKRVLEKTRGSADLLLVWEGGDDQTGLRVVDGVVTEHEVVHTLGKVKT